MLTNDCAIKICNEGCSKAAEMVLDKLPLDAVALIFSQLNVKELQKTRLVNQAWSCISSDFTQKYNPILLKRLVQFLYDSLENDLLKCQMQEILTEVNTWNIDKKTLLEISDWLLETRDNLVYLLTSLDPHHIKKLADSSKELKNPIFFDKLFAIARIMSELEHSKFDKDQNLSPYAKVRAGKVGIAAIQLCGLGCTNKAFRLVDTTPSITMKYESWYYHGSDSAKFANFRIQIQQNCSLRRFDKIVEVAKSILLQDSKFITFDLGYDQDNSVQMICEELVKAKKLKKANEILECIHSPYKKEDVLKIMKKTKICEPLKADQIIALQINLKADCLG